MAWQWPLGRTVQDSIDHYDDCYTKADSAECSYFHVNRRKVVADLQVAFLRQLMGERRGRLIDVGAGDGVFVQQALLAGFEAYGIEPSPAGVHAANARFGQPRVVCGLLAETPADATYDVVTIWDVIEHVEDPLGLLVSAATRLRPGGWLIVETGNYQSAERLLAGKAWWAYHPEHRWYFTPRVMRALFQRIGLNETTLCQRTLRPGSPSGLSSSLSETVMSGLRRPVKLRTELWNYWRVRQAVRAWPEWAHLPIFALAGRTS